ncbi:DNA helicase NDAI_0C06200 [Naumovozyma dairenensis CBS 421]|uniref:ATP-dependent DNA helicase CHL1 n=1 Tax=Naumovozyma dairenensis (strain ATCC 10597 / BCRC 20456 / CBS 421 / NBRC 0211 / NRRL Y-12639) TaxID=1071378 RepID=G0W918_NAUDC|nr:hypothetical protein NDAI_0C06200 [Naumovozyma dairenensis CBS 421]CCD24279.1 hypothetical protein NDAI_0C06200 [Naumovozyma dairenensis CBS 421]
MNFPTTQTDPQTNKFHHPYKPYDIQLQLMKCVYDVLNEDKKIAILESPTGTGKTLSLICATITWLRENKADYLAGISKKTTIDSNENTEEHATNDSDEEEDEPDWVNERYKNSILKDRLHLLKDYEDHLDHLKGKKTITKTASKINTNIIRPYKRLRKNTDVPQLQVTISEQDLLPQPYNSDSEDISCRQNEKDSIKLNKDVQALLSKLETKERKLDQDDKWGNASPNPIKIYFTSRTHSQLSQFASQLRLPTFPSSFKDDVPHERIKYIPLGSKKILCINPNVKKFKTVDAINDACSETRHSKEGCPFYQNTPTWHNDRDTLAFRDNVYEDVHDIEDTVTVGESLGVCPYYAIRDSIPGAEVITLPYQYLFSESMRESLKIDLENSIVIIDEAHNLIDTINSIHSAEISITDLQKCSKGLQLYLQKFKLKLNAGNRVNLLKLIKLLNVITKFITDRFEKPGQEFNPSEIFNNSNADVLNIHKLNKYIKRSKIAYKIETYMDSLKIPSESKTQAKKSPSAAHPLLFKIVTFLTTLTNPTSEGQFFFEKGKAIKYMLLEPSKQFEPIIEKSKCVILAGGTMEPISDFYDNLFPSISKDLITSFSCDHVIPDKNLETFIINESQFEFTFEKRQNISLVNGALFQFYLQLSQNVPKSGGIVGFFPSYQYLQFIIDKWKHAGLFDKLYKIRKIFFESKDGPDPLSEYSEAVTNGDGAILFAIVGGKLSEGINFQDNLCRAIVMVGLPYPNVFSGELLVKKNHLEKKILKEGGSKQDVSTATRNFYEIICMKAVNQSVGRAIRHANDHATVYLLDKRFISPNIRTKLSHWISGRIQKEDTIMEVMKKTKNFFSKHK